MHTHRHPRHLVAAFVLIAGGGLLPGPLGQALSDWPAAAQSPARPPTLDRPAAAQPARPALAGRPAPAPPSAVKPGEVASDPIRCWWKTDRTAVTVGERFVLVLTCGVIEAGRTTVVPNTSQLEGGAIQITPFEVVSAVRHEDVVASPWRYLQFEYSVRVLNDGFFGQDVNIPALTVTYNVQAPGGGTQGRDQSYMLPALPMRVLSLVPKSATDIRDASDQTFAEVESGRFRALAARVAAWISLAFAAAFALLTGLHLAGRFRKRDAATVPPIPATALLGGCLQALQALKSEVSSAGWSAESARRALTVLRIAGASALDRRVTQKVVDRATAEREGQLVVRTGWLRRGRAMVSAPTTSPSITSSLQNGHAPAARIRVSLEQIGGSLHALNNAAYGRGEPPDSSNLDEALGEGIEAIRRLRTSSRWPMRTFEAVSRSIFGM